MRQTAARRSGHVTALDGLRGLAALIVVIRHSFNSIIVPLSVREAVLQSPLALFLNGQGAVQLFFVLSGYVLASSLSRSREWIGIGQFVVKRVFRIHPPYVFAVLFAWTASFFYPQLPPDAGVMPSIRAFAEVHVEVPALLDSLLFPGPAYNQLPVGWTLRIEMIFSLLLPILFLVARRIHWLLLLVASSYCLANPDRTLVYMVDFSLGIAVFLERDRLLSFLRGAGAPARAAGVLGALFLFHAPLLLGWSARFRGILVSGFLPREIAIMGVGAAGLVIACLGVPWVEAALSSRPCRYLGRISYSLYLVHGPILILCTRLLAGASSAGANVAFFFSVVAASIAVSDLSYRWIERPSIAMGNRICRWLAGRTGTTPVPSELVPPRS